MLRRLLPLALLVALGGCGGAQEPAADARVPGRMLTVYASLPAHGDSAAQAAAVGAGARLALADAGGRAGDYRVRLVELDSSDPDGGGWDPAIVAANADRAADDPTTIAYVGELDFGGSAVSVPITNEADVLQVSPSDGLTSLTRSEPTEPGPGPERYYPSGRRTFVRLTPSDLLQASTLVTWAREGGARRLATVSDQGLFGRETADESALISECQGMSLVSSEELDGGPEAIAALARRIDEENPDAVIYAGAADDAAEPLLDALQEDVGAGRVIAAGGVASRAVAAPPPAGDAAGRGVASFVRASRPASTYPPAARRVLRRIAVREPPTALSADALYGYESMALVLDAIEAAGEHGGDRRAVSERALEPRARESVLGRYRIDAFGDVDENRFAGYRERGGELTFAGVRRPGLALAPPSPKLARPASPCKELQRLRG